MKLNKLLVLAAAFVLGLSACNGPQNGKDDDESKAESESSEVAPSESESESESEDEGYTPYSDSGTTEGFPTEAVETFINNYGLAYEIPAVANDQTWGYEASFSMGTPQLVLWTEDTGEPGVDAIEDEFKTLLEEAGLEVDDSLYDYYGYIVWNENDEMDIVFYTYNYEFDLYIYGPTKTYDLFPSDMLNDYLASLGSEVEVPAPVSENVWVAYVVEDDTDSYFYAGTDDEGAPYIDDDDDFHEGVNAIEDAYKATLEAAGWEVDDTYYDDDGYYAYKDDVEICFYSWNGSFSMSVYLAA